MSNTDQALDHAEVARRAIDRPQTRFWTDIALGNLPRDLILPWGITVKRGVDDRMESHCIQCKAVEQTPNVAAVADFRDQHWYCGEGGSQVYQCDRCGRLELAGLPECRFCGCAMPTGKMPLVAATEMVLKQRGLYGILNGERTLATVKCGSLLRAQRAARAMFPGRSLHIVLEGCEGRWTETGPSRV